MDNVKVIKGNIVTPDSVLNDGFLTIKNGKIASIDKQGTSHSSFINASGKYILPGAIDAHVHCYSSLKEGFENATKSAAAGGVTTIIEMPYDANQLICTEQLFEEKKERIEQEAIVDVAMLATISPSGKLDHIPLLTEAGACGIKVSLYNTDSVRFPKIYEDRLYEAFSIIKKVGMPVGVHAETDSIVNHSIQKYRELGKRLPIAHCYSRPKVAESTAVLTALELAYETNVKLHIYHCTFPRIFHLVHQYKKEGVDVTAETCTHYLVLNEQDMDRLKAKGKINPPLRTKHDMNGLWNLVGKGQVDMVTSDHAPWTIERKQHTNIFDNASGAPGVEVLLPILFSEGVAKGKISLLNIVKLLSENPANRFGLGHRKGKIAVDYDADIVILDPQKKWSIEEEKMYSTAGWSPYHGVELYGQIEKTFVRGKEVYNGQVIGEKGDGIFIHAQHK